MTPRLDIPRLLGQEAALLLAARERGSVIHRTADIDTAGDEVEEAFRSFLARRLPAAYRVTHGHLVDANQVSSAQLDVMVLDALASFSLCTASDGTEYFPVEAAFAIGEIKTQYRRASQPIEAFSRAVAGVRALNRPAIAPNEAPGAIGFAGPGIRGPSGLPLHNPLFTFMVFVEAGDFDEQELVRLLDAVPIRSMPGLVALLDVGIVAPMAAGQQGNSELVRYPDLELVPAPYLGLARPPAGTDVRGEVLRFLLETLASHLSVSAVRTAQFAQYAGDPARWSVAAPRSRSLPRSADSEVDRSYTGQRGD